VSATDILGDRLQAARSDRLTTFNAYQLSLQNLIYPVALHCVFNAVAAATIWMLGQPIVAFAYFVVTCLGDAVQNRIFKGWLDASRTTEVQAGFRRLAVMVGVRGTLYMSGATAVAVLEPSAGAFAYLAVCACAVLALAQSYGVFSRLVFWSMAAPTLLIVAAVTALGAPLLSVLGVWLALASLGVTLLSISYLTVKNTNQWQATHNARQTLIDDLAAAHDRAVQERAAADEAREAARQANLAKSAFLATMSHEIRTPMNGVLGMAELLMREETEPAQIKRLETLISSGEYLMSILNDILDFSKIDAGRVEISVCPEDLGGFLDQLVAFWGPRADEKALTLRLDVDASLPPAVQMDSLRVRQVMFNLLGNALKFTDTGSVSLRARAEAIDNRRVNLRLSVIDSGPGIAEEHLPLLFERFSQGERSTGGTGLGLAIARQLCELMGGRIWAESTLGAGSTFHVELPLTVAELAPPSLERAGATEEVELPPLKVLAVDDNAINLLVLEQLLAVFGHSVSKADDGASALDILAAEAFDIVLMDIQMPGMSGIEALNALRASSGPNANAPVIALTADVVSGGRDHYVRLGFDGHAAKPIQIADLIAAIAQTLNQRPEFLARAS
jgi:signal transduction histidine kinase/CheY-like chemotaxis protein